MTLFFLKFNLALLNFKLSHYGLHELTDFMNLFTTIIKIFFS
ncbi:hypothetical protein ACUY4Q_004991 (plasmid) [Phytobacter sp. AG2a]